MDAYELTAKRTLFIAKQHKKRPQAIPRLGSYLKKYKREFYAAFACMVLYGASDGILPLLIKQILDGVFAEQNQDLLYALPLILVAFTLVRALVDVGQHFILARIGHRIIRDIRNEAQENLIKLSPGYYVRKSSADLIARLTSDIVFVRELLTNSTASIVRDSIRIVALLVAAIYLDPFLAAIAFVVFPLGLLPVYTFGKRMRKLSTRGQEAIGTISSYLQESVGGIRVIKIFNRERQERKRFQEENERLTRTFVKTELIQSLSGPVNEILAVFAIAGIVLYGGLSVIGGTRTQGEFIAFLFAVFLLYDPFKKLSKLNNKVQQGLSCAERVFELIDIEPDIEEPANPIPFPHNVTNLEFRNVSFRYTEDQEDLILDTVSFSLSKGQKLALVGFSGAGKSTLVDLLPRFIDPISGSIHLNGIDIRDFELKELREAIAMVGQHTFLFHNTVRHNIKYGNSDATDADIIEAAKAARAFDFIQDLPHGFDTIIGEGGMSLSGGERQRIAIARAMLKNAPLLILDEATASLDNKSEFEVQNALSALAQERTSIVIAHRLSTIRDADCILVLDKGNVVEMGSHKELLSRDGHFRKLYDLQFSSHHNESEPLPLSTED